MSKTLSPEVKAKLLEVLKQRFEKHLDWYPNLDWKEVQMKLEVNEGKLFFLNQMELSGGEPALIEYRADSGVFIFCDCSAESPTGRRSLCYDEAALNARKENKPKGSAVGMAAEMGIELLTEDDYRKLQSLGNFDIKTSSWLKTPEGMRKLGGAIFGDFRFNRVFVYHNGVESYYAARGFRGKVII